MELFAFASMGASFLVLALPWIVILAAPVLLLVFILLGVPILMLKTVGHIEEGAEAFSGTSISAPHSLWEPQVELPYKSRRKRISNKLAAHHPYISILPFETESG